MLRHNRIHWSARIIFADTSIANPLAVSRFALRTIQQMRDLRRYNVPVTINNPKQVNIAADGGQQVNVQNKALAKSGERKIASNKPQPVLEGEK